jgi:molybdopterin-guanine dinucleotide biosynthesis protein
MPILKQEFENKNPDAFIAEFGTGDIAIAEGFHRESGLPSVVLSNDTEKPVERWDVEDVSVKGKTVDQLEGPVIELRFSHPKSIDILIEYLEKCKTILTDASRTNQAK